MARDYAHSPKKGGRQTKGRGGGGGSGMPGWVWLVFGLSIGLTVAAFVYIKRTPDNALPGQQHEPAAEEEPAAEKPAEKPKKKPRETVKLPPEEKPRFRFYEMLPSEEVVVPRADKEAAKASGDGSTYVIQVASYRDKEEADKQKASLALLGIESRIETVTIDGNETFYRVRVGPLKDYGKVQIISNRLADNGVEAVVIKLK